MKRIFSICKLLRYYLKQKIRNTKYYNKMGKECSACVLDIITLCYDVIAHASFPQKRCTVNVVNKKLRVLFVSKYFNLSRYLQCRKKRTRILLMNMSVEGQFFLSITGSIEHAEFYDVDNAYCKYGFHFGPEWSVVAVSP